VLPGSPFEIFISIPRFPLLGFIFGIWLAFACLFIVARQLSAISEDYLFTLVCYIND
jgi:hypothetical protein